jgi:hypothetical protein
MKKKTFTAQAETLRATISTDEIGPTAKMAGVSARWIRYFINGHIPNPGVKTLDKLAQGLAAYRKGKK